jgi:hypothetical protein
MQAVLHTAYHLALLPIHLALLPVWRPPAAAALIAAAARLTGLARSPRGPALSAAAATLAGWLLQGMPAGAWPHLVWMAGHAGWLPGFGLAGLAVIVAADMAVRTGRRGPRWWLLPASAAACAWWLRGAPLSGAGIINGMPVFLCLCAAFPLARRLARTDPGWGSAGAALALAGSLAVTGAAPAWPRAALVPGAAGLVLLGLRDVGPALASLLVVVAAATLVASDHGRLTPVDAACLVPLLAWVLVPLLTPRISRTGPALACLVAAGVCVGLAWLGRKEGLLF